MPECESILAIDPGPTESAWCLYENGKPFDWNKTPNEELIVKLGHNVRPAEILVIEKVESFGMAVGAEVFETVFWSGRFAQKWGPNFNRLGRKDVKLHLCGSMRAKDANIRQALIDRFGGPAAIGKKKSPGPLFGISGDVWSALAVAVTWAETRDAAV